MVLLILLFSLFSCLLLNQLQSYKQYSNIHCKIHIELLFFLSWGPITSSVCYLFLLTIYIGICIFQLSRHNFIHCLATCIKKILPKFVSSEISLLFMHAIQAYSLCIIQAKMFPATDTNPLFFFKHLKLTKSEGLSVTKKKMNQTKYCDNKCCDLKYIYRQSNSLISALRECSLTDVHLIQMSIFAFGKFILGKIVQSL